jgi:hypothetical protein
MISLSYCNFDRTNVGKLKRLGLESLSSKQYQARLKLIGSRSN